MAIKNKALLFLSLLVPAILLGAVYYNRENIGQDIYCTADTVEHMNNDELRINLTINMQSETGVTQMIGRLFKKNQLIGTISRQIHYEYVKRGYSYTFTTTRVERTKTDTVPDEVLSPHVSDIFIKPGTVLNVTVYPQRSAGWVFFLNSTPALVCNKSF